MPIPSPIHPIKLCVSHYRATAGRASHKLFLSTYLAETAAADSDILQCARLVSHLAINWEQTFARRGLKYEDYRLRAMSQPYDRSMKYFTFVPLEEPDDAPDTRAQKFSWDREASGGIQGEVLISQCSQLRVPANLYASEQIWIRADAPNFLIAHHFEARREQALALQEHCSNDTSRALWAKLTEDWQPQSFLHTVLSDFAVLS